MLSSATIQWWSVMLQTVKVKGLCQPGTLREAHELCDLLPPVLRRQCAESLVVALYCHVRFPPVVVTTCPVSAALRVM